MSIQHNTIKPVIVSAAEINTPSATLADRRVDVSGVAKVKLYYAAVGTTTILGVRVSNTDTDDISTVAHCSFFLAPGESELLDVGAWNYLVVKELTLTSGYEAVICEVE